MKRFTMFACLALALVFAIGAYAGQELPRYARGGGSQVLTSEVPNAGKALGDTICLIGPGAESPVALGDFEAGWNGWFTVDNTQLTVEKWQASTYFAVAGTYSAWCGEDIPSCGPGDPDGGYGNGYNEMLEWRGAVANNTLSCTVTVVATLQYDTEPGYDYSYLSYEKFDQGFTDVIIQDGAGVLNINETFSYTPADYMGAGANEVVVLFRVTSDGGWSDGDCSWPTAGACQLDDVQIGLTNGLGYATGFEDGTLGAFTVRFPVAVGDFGQLWTGLEDFDPCATNYSQQVGFIDDGLVVPGTGGTPCQNWCYGPAGNIVNTTGGLAGPTAHIDNTVVSPEIPWQDQTQNGCSFVFDVYRHEDLGADAPGIFYIWDVRSSGDNGATWSDWQNRNFVYYGGPNYFRHGGAVSDLLVTGRTHIQVRMGVYELGWAWGWNGNDGYPAPYFDNVRVISYPIVGPQFSTREIDLANDGFIEQDGYDSLNPGSNHVRFDMAQNISLAEHLRNDPGDSLVFDCVVTRAGAALTGNPRMYYTLKRNPIFDPYRTSGLPDQGFVLCDTARNAAGLPVTDKFFADLPDTGFFFPGDKLRYFIYAEDDAGGDIQSSTLPGDTTGFSDWSSVLQYSSSYTVRALPTITSLAGDQPTTLFWNDFANRGGQQEWYGAFANLGLIEGRDYDEYYTNGPSSGVSNGLGGRASELDLVGYTDMLYTCGDLGVNTISNGDFNNDAGDDVGVVTAWLQQGGKDALFTGDDLASDLAQAGAATNALLTNYFSVSVVSNDIRPLIGTQTSPRVLPEAGNPVFSTVSSWVAYGGCASINTFDAVTPINTAQRIAQFANSAGNPGGYAYSAATLNTVPLDNARIISVPYDFMYIYTDPNETAQSNGLAARTRFLADVLTFFSVPTNPGDVSSVPGAEKFAVSNYPNPFNPSTTIKYTVAKPGHLTLKIYNVRGELVKTLIDGHVDVSSQVEWDGSNNAGAKVSSGVYFYEARMGNEVQVNKMALVK
jgi:hypothetical protein